MQHGVHEWSCPPPQVDPARILRVHKYTNPERVRPVIREAAIKAAAAAADLSAPLACYTTRSILSVENDCLALSDGTVFHCPVFGEHLVGSTEFLAFVITIGPSLDEKVISLVNDVFEPLDALFLETAGWLTIEAATRKLTQHMKAEFATRGLKLSLRMGPGYDYPSPDRTARHRWDLREQRGLFDLFGNHPLPVTLMESCAMTPKMSRSGAFGLNMV